MTIEPSDSIETRLHKLGLRLPQAFITPPGTNLSFRFVRVRGTRVFISGHVAQNPDGTIAGPFGKIGKDLTVEQAYTSARLTALSILGDLKREFGTLDTITAWLKVTGFVNVANGFTQTPAVVNGFSDLILELYGPERGIHARSAVGVAALPFNAPIEIEAEVEIMR